MSTNKRIKKSKNIEVEIDPKKKSKHPRNIIIYSLSGASFTALPEKLADAKISEENILKDVFKGKKLSDISYTKITESSFKDLEGKMKEDIRVYFSTSTDEIWNYNPIMSAFMGTLVYSSVLVFVSENEMEDTENPGEPMEHEFFVQIVAGFIQTCAQYAYQSIAGESEEKKKKEIAKSPMFNLSKIEYVMSLLPKCRESVQVRPGKDKGRLDEFWKENYVGKYSPDFVFNDIVALDEEVKDYVKTFIMLKPGLMTMYSPDTGKASLYLMQTTFTQFKDLVNKINEEIEDLGPDPKKEEIDKVKQEILQSLYS